MEEWRTVTENDKYEVSSLGNVRNKESRLVLKKMKNSVGRNIVDLGRDMRGKLIYRLVAKAFLPRQEGKDEIDHINRDYTDDRLCNLRWADRSENNINTCDKGTSSGHRCIYKTSTSYCVQICRNKVVVYRKNFSDLEEAIQNRNHFLDTYTQTQNLNPCIQDQPLSVQ